MKPRYAPWKSLIVRATVYALTVFVVSIWSLSFYIGRSLQADMQQLLGAQQLSVVTAVAQEVNNNLTDRLQALETVAKEMDAALLTNPAALQARLQQRPLLQLLFNAGSFVTDLKGTAIADVSESANRIGVNYMERDFITATLKEGKSAIGRPVMGKQLNAPVLVMSAPVRDAQGKVIGALAGVTNLGQPSFLDKITQNIYGKTGGYVLVAAQYRQVVTATDKSRVMESLPAPGLNIWVDRFVNGYEGSTVAANPKGVNVLASGKGIPAAGWYVLATLPTDEAFLPLYQLRQRLLWATLLLTLLTGALTWLILRRQLAPLVETSQAMMALADSKQLPHPLATTSQGEIGQLVTGFNRLLQSWTQREAALLDSQQNLTITLNAIGDAVIATDTVGRITRMNPAAERLTAWPLADALGQPLSEVFRIVNAETRLPSVSPVQRVMAKGEVIGLANHTTLLARNGSEFQIADSAAPIRNASLAIVGVVLVFSDVTGKYRSELALKESEQRYRSLLENLSAGVVVHRTDTTILLSNAMAADLLGLTQEQMAGKAAPDPDWCFVREDGTPLPLAEYPVNLILASDRPLQSCVLGVRHQGRSEPTWLSCNGYPVRDDQGKILQAVVTFTDITASKEHQSRLEHIAHFDALTHLPNRVLLADRLHQAMAQAQRRHQQVAVAFLDLDGFKAINDHYGHLVGDQVLITLAKRMLEALREGDTLARIGGDEFVAVLIDLEDTSFSVPLLNRMLAAAALPVRVGELAPQVSASLGVTFYPQAQDIDADQLMRQADQAMYQAKMAGKNRYCVFDAVQDSSMRVHHESLERIRTALDKREFVLHYQPKVNMHSGQVIGAEALIRWQHPEKGLLVPAAFLPVIEDHPLAVAVGEWVIDTALIQMELWQAVALNLPVSVNISARQLQQANFVTRLQAILARHPQVKPASLELELLETSALADMTQVSKIVEDCAQMGVTFALDDFGTGYSSLTYLKRLRVNLLKIDQSFVRDMLDDPDDLAILQGVISLAGAFKREVMAEGVETVAHGTALLQLGCELAQGYGIARPMPADQLPSWASTWQPDVAWRGSQFR